MIRTGVVGCGWYGSGLTQEINRLPGMCPRLLVDRHLEKITTTYKRAGIDQSAIFRVCTPQDMRRARECGAQYVIATDIAILQDVNKLGLDVIFDATGDLLGGVTAALAALSQDIPFLTVSAELDGTVGLALQQLATDSGGTYAFADGDQPAVLARMIDEVVSWGFKPRISGNCKGFLDTHQNPAGVRPFVPHHQNTKKICSYADGSKQSLEMAVLGNARGFYPFKRGMCGPTTSKSSLISSFRELLDADPGGGPYLDYVVGINGIDQGAGVFVIAQRDEAEIRRDMKYLKKGDGPYYLFFRDHHLCYLEAPRSIVEALSGTRALSPTGRHVDVVTMAKRDVPAGHALDGIGGYDCYGLAERASISTRERCLPIGLAEFAVVTRNVSQDMPITYDMVELEENQVVELRRRLESMSLP